jgi:hypothetical protein
MNSHFFYPTASGSLGEARRLGCEETIVKRESENPVPNLSGQDFAGVVRPKPPILITEDNDDGLHSDSRGVPTLRQ